MIESDEEAVLAIVRATSQTIQSLGSVPEGVMFSVMQSHLPWLSLSSFEMLLGTLEKLSLVIRENHLIIWVGEPEIMN